MLFKDLKFTLYLINIICAFKIIIVILLQVSLSKNNLILYYLNTFSAILITAHFL